MSAIKYKCPDGQYRVLWILQKYFDKLGHLLYELGEREARERFFSAIGIPDDGRKEPFLIYDPDEEE